MSLNKPEDNKQNFPGHLMMSESKMSSVAEMQQIARQLAELFKLPPEWAATHSFRLNGSGASLLLEWRPLTAAQRRSAKRAAAAERQRQQQQKPSTAPSTEESLEMEVERALSEPASPSPHIPSRQL